MTKYKNTHTFYFLSSVETLLIFQLAFMDPT